MPTFSLNDVDGPFDVTVFETRWAVACRSTGASGRNVTMQGGPRSMVSAAMTALVVLVGCPSRAFAQEIQLIGPLRAAPVGRREWRDERTELAPVLGLGVTRGGPVALAGGEVLVHPADALGLGAFGVFGVPGEGGEKRGVLRSLVGPELVLVPISTRAALFQKIFFAFDLHVEGGAGWVTTFDESGGQGRLDGSVGAGLTAFASWDWSFAIDYRELVGDVVIHTITLSVGFWPQRPRWDDE